MTDATCRGSYALGTACGRCARCKAEKDRYYASMEVDAALNTPSISLRKIREAEARGRVAGLREAIDCGEKYTQGLVEGYSVHAGWYFIRQELFARIPAEDE